MRERERERERVDADKGETALLFILPLSGAREWQRVFASSPNTAHVSDRRERETGGETHWDTSSLIGDGPTSVQTYSAYRPWVIASTNLDAVKT